jgi:hypothetical protein
MSEANIRRARALSWSKQTWMWIAAATLLAAFAVYAAVYWFEVVDETEWVGVKGEAASNPFLALEKLLAAQGATVIPAPRAAVLDTQLQAGGPSAIVLGANRLQNMTPARINAIEAWVASGGQLIVESERLMLDDPLLAKWGLERKRLVWRRGKYVEVDRKRPPRVVTEGSKAGEGAGDDPVPGDPEMEFEIEEGQSLQPVPRSPFAPQRSMPSQAVSTVALGDGISFQVAFVPHQNLVVLNPVTQSRLTTPALIRDRFGGRIAEISMGRGRITAISGFDFMKWKALTKADHAEFIWHLVSRGGNRGGNDSAVKPTVLMMARPAGMGFSQWVIENAWMVVVSLLLLIGVWIWSVLPRFGPLLPALTTERRSLGEHIRAAGGWLASRREWSALLAPVRARFWSRLTHRYPRAASMSATEKLELAARAASISISDATWLLNTDVHSRRECLQVMSALIDATARLDGEGRPPSSQFAR